jgi:osmoprotectant transport system permease protein
MHFLSQVFAFLTSRANWEGTDGALVRLGLQAELSAAVIAAAAVVGVAAGFALGFGARGGLIAVNAANAARAVPSVTLLTLLATLPAIGLTAGGFTTAFITLFALAVPPILTNSYVGMREVDADVIEAAKGVGMTGWQRFWQVEFRLALPLAVAGIRTAAVEVVATATLAAYVTFNDLGEFIFAGLSINNTVEAFAGAVLVALLAGFTDLLLLAAFRLAIPKPLRLQAGYARERSRGVLQSALSFRARASSRAALSTR